MKHIADATESIEDFFARYTRYLTEGDIEGLANIYNYPALAVTARGCLSITEPQQSRDFFSQGQKFYRSRGIHGVRARDIVTCIEVPGIWVGHLILENLDESGSPVGEEHNAYQVVTLPDGTRRIAVSTPLDAYNPDQKSGVKENISKSTTKTYKLTITRVFDAPVERVWSAWVEPEMVKKWWGPEGFTVPVVEMDFCEGGTSLVSMQAPEEMGGSVLYNTWEYTKIVPNERLEFILRFTDRDRSVLNPQDIGIPEGVPGEVPHVITFKDVGGGKTEMFYAEYGYTTADALETSKAGLEQVLDKLAESLKGQ